jgi:hypothetical protein
MEGTDSEEHALNLLSTGKAEDRSQTTITRFAHHNGRNPVVAGIPAQLTSV